MTPLRSHPPGSRADRNRRALRALLSAPTTGLSMRKAKHRLRPRARGRFLLEEPI